VSTPVSTPHLNTPALDLPRALGYRMPAEWERHTATWIAWPHNANDWPGKFQPIAWVYADIVKHLSRVEQVQILVNNVEAERRARRILSRVHANLSQVHFQPWPTNRIWTRDSGPIFIRKTADPQQLAHLTANDTLAVTNWQFNAWAKYDDWQLDNQLPMRVAELLGMPAFTPVAHLPDGSTRPVVLEGGSIDTNGAGVLLTTEECLLSQVQQRNPGVSREQLERVFNDYLGIDQVLWMNRGIAGDDTHGHIDDITRFTDANTIVTAVEPNRQDENYLPLAENLDRLRAARNLDGQPFHIVELPLPSPVIFDKQRLPASYANFYIANRLVLVPTFNDANDRHALNTLAALFPQHRIVGIHCGDFIWGLGALHCMTQQQPASLLPAAQLSAAHLPEPLLS
jgi:agmatine deiminase